MYRCKYFKITELIPNYLLESFRTQNKDAWTIFDKNLLISIDKIREIYGIIIINNKFLNECGLRRFEYNGLTNYSAHKLGRGLDLHILKIELLAEKYNSAIKRKELKILEYNKIRTELLQNKDFDCLNFENNISWLHIDTLNRGIRLFNG